MPYATHLRLTCSGVFRTATGTPWETFSYRLNLSDPGVNVTAGINLKNSIADFAADAVAFHGAAATRISSTARLTEVKLARINTLGKYSEDPAIQAVDTPGGGTTTIPAPQTALAVSLMTARRGATGRGRFYIPLPIDVPDPATGKITAGNVQQVLTSCQTFLNALNNLPGVALDAQPKVTVASTKGYNSDVTQVRLGLVLDTIRSRRQAIAEAYLGPVAVS